MLKVRDVLKAKSDKIWSISAHTSVFTALEIMDEHNIESIVVTDRGCVVGIFSERDCARTKILDRKSLKITSVRKLMSTPLYSISPEKSIEECVNLMADTHSSHLTVFQNNKLIGIVSEGDMEQFPEYKIYFKAFE